MIRESLVLILCTQCNNLNSIAIAHFSGRGNFQNVDLRKVVIDKIPKIECRIPAFAYNLQISCDKFYAIPHMIADVRAHRRH